MADYGYLAHHGVKGQKWGVRKQKPTSGTRVSSPTKPSPNKRKAIAIGVLAALGTAAVAGGTVAAVKNPEVVSRALGSIGKAFAKAPKAASQNGWKFTTVTKELKKAKRANRRSNIKNSIKTGFTNTKNTISKIGKNTSSGVLAGLREAGAKLTTKETVKEITRDSIVKGTKSVAGAAVAGGMALGVKTAISGKKPTRSEMASYLTKNPNKKDKK